MKLKLSVFTLLFFFNYTFSQQIQLSPQAEVSVLTFGPGTNLNDAFGHNAFRIKDESRGIDLVYGYGEYDFDAPNFYLKFARGKLKYLISRHRFSDIFYHYSSYNRSIKEHVLNLSLSEKQKLFTFLEHNYKPENRRYVYDFFYDNCATKIRDITLITTKDDIVFEAKVHRLKTFRSLIYEHLNKNSWGSLGIDVALGSIIDRKATKEEYMFLPKYIHSFFESAKIGDVNLVERSSTLYGKKAIEASGFLFFFSPLFILGLISLLIIFCTYRDFKSQKRSKWLDVLLFAIIGLIGVMLLLLWFATDHTATAYNYNLLWAFPLNILLVFQLYKTKVKRWVKGFLKFLILMLCLMTLHWLIGVQVFALVLIPVLIAILLRYFYLLKTLEHY